MIDDGMFNPYYDDLDVDDVFMFEVFESFLISGKDTNAL